MTNYFNQLSLREQLSQLGICRFMDADEFNSGVNHGFCMAKLAVRDIDRQINPPERKNFTPEDWSFEYEIYNTRKDLLYKIYEAINKSMEEEVHENDY